MLTQTSSPTALGPRPRWRDLRSSWPPPRRNRGWLRFTRFKPGVAGLFFVICLILLAIFAPAIVPHDPTEVHTRLRGARRRPSSRWE
jgi:ABC-type antimicrobial peptide transport system permease subunit